VHGEAAVSEQKTTHTENAQIANKVRTASTIPLFQANTRQQSTKFVKHVKMAAALVSPSRPPWASLESRPPRARESSTFVE